MSRVGLEIRDDVAIVTLNDPDRRNALTPVMVREIETTFDELEADASVGAVVVTGAGSAFCAGAHLDDLSAASKERLLSIYQGFARVARSSLTTVAAVNGPAVGAGMNLALACDLRIAGRRAWFDPRFLQLGVHPGGGHLWMLRDAVGSQTAAAMALFGEIVDGADAARRGLVWRCVEDEDLLVEAVALAQRSTAAPHALVRRIKTTLAETRGVDTHAEALERELAPQLWSFEMGWFAERMATRGRGRTPPDG